jgi:hypothetical protein
MSTENILGKINSIPLNTPHNTPENKKIFKSKLNKFEKHPKQNFNKIVIKQPDFNKFVQKLPKFDKFENKQPKFDKFKNNVPKFIPPNILRTNPNNKIINTKNKNKYTNINTNKNTNAENIKNIKRIKNIKNAEDEEYYNSIKNIQNNTEIVKSITFDKGPHVINKYKLPKDAPKVESISTQKYLYNFYNNNQSPVNSSKPFPYSSLNGIGNRCINNVTNIPTMSLIQSSTYMTVKNIADNGSINRGMLVNHSTGSGKTLLGTAIMDAFWETDKNIIFLTSVEALNANPPSNFYKEAMRYFERFDKPYINYTTNEERIKKVKTLFDKRKIQFLTFAQLAHTLLISRELKRVKTDEDKIKHRNLLNNAVLIVDEVQNVFKAIVNQRGEYSAIKKFLEDHNNPFTKKLKIFILTATPGTNIQQFVDLMNWIREIKSKPIEIPDLNNSESINIFKSRLKGLITYYDARNDYSRFPKKYYMPKQIGYMSKTQFEKYAEKLKELNDDETDFLKLEKEDKINNYYRTLRRFSNALYELTENMKLADFSVKIPLLLQNIIDYPIEKHYVYSAFYINRGTGGHGIMAVAKFLEEKLGYVKLTLQEAVNGINTLDKRKRFMLATSTQLNETASSSIARENLKNLIKVYNDPLNKYGEYVHVMLASQNYNEGIDLRGLRNIHILEPLLTQTMQKQLIGRAVRFCSHSDYPKDQWTVKIWEYFSDFPANVSIYDISNLEVKLKNAQDEYNLLDSKSPYKNKIKDEVTNILNQIKIVKKIDYANIRMIDKKIFLEAKKRAQPMDKLNDIIMESAFDCLLTKKFHNKNLTCNYE